VRPVARVIKTRPIAGTSAPSLPGQGGGPVPGPRAVPARSGSDGIRALWSSEHLGLSLCAASPGLRGTSYPGCAAGGCANPERVASFLPLTEVNLTLGVRRLRVSQPLQGWRPLSVRLPRVARASQPWAERCNPFRIATSAGGSGQSAPFLLTHEQDQFGHPEPLFSVNLLNRC
jgi:hypothetical protein